jgi:hypothetical protein
VVVPDLLHFVVPAVELARTHVPVVLVLNGARSWEAQHLGGTFPEVPTIRLRTLPRRSMSHGQIIDLLLRSADRDVVLHDPDLYVFDPAVYRELRLAPGELAAGPFGILNRRSGLSFLTTPLLALSGSAVQDLMARHAIGPGVYRKTPSRLAPALRARGIDETNFPKDYLPRYDPLDLLMAVGILEGLRLRELSFGDDAVFHVGGVSYLRDNYRLDYVHQRFLELSAARAFASRYRPRLGGRKALEDLRSRFLADGAGAALERIDALIDRLAAALSRC